MPLDAKAPVDGELSALRTRVQATPGDVDSLVLLARAWVQKARNSGDPGFYLHADGCAREALLLRPGFAPANNLRALAMLNGHRFAEARDLAHGLLAADRDDVMALGTLSDALLELGDVDGAAEASQRMIDLRPSLPSYARASYLLWLRGDERGALESIRLAYDAGRGQKDREPTAWVLTEAAHIFRNGGDLPGAIAGYDKALAEHAAYTPALVGKARSLLGLGNRAAAIPMLERALAQEPALEAAWLLGDALALEGRDAEAERAWTEARRIGTQSDPRGLALFLATKNLDLDAAQKALDEDRKARGGIYADDIEALIAWRKGDTPRAVAAIARAVRFGTPDPRLRLHEALIAGDATRLKDALARGGASDIVLAKLAH